MTRALLAALAVVVSSAMYLPSVVESTTSAVILSDPIRVGSASCRAIPADSLSDPVVGFHEASIDFRISK